MVALDSVARRGSGHTPSQKHSEYWDGGVKWVSLADSSALDSGYIQDTVKKISAQGLAKSSAVLHPKGTVIVSRDAGVGKSAILGDAMAVSQHFIAWVCDENRLCPEYLYQWLQSHQKVFERMAVGSTIKTIGLSYFKRLKIPLPDRQTQTEISKVLFAWDFAIEKTKRLIAANQGMHAHELMLATSLGDRGSRFRFGDLFTPSKTKIKEDTEVEVLSVTRAGVIRQSDYFNKSVTSEDRTGYLLVRRGQLVMSGLNFWMGAIDFQNVCDAGIVSPAYKVFDLNSELVDADYMRFYVRSGAMRRVLLAASVQGASIVRRNLDIEALEESIVRLPSLAEQRVFAMRLAIAARQIENLQACLELICIQKRGLMKKLLTGQWRINAAKEQAA